MAKAAAAAGGAAAAATQAAAPDSHQVALGEAEAVQGAQGSVGEPVASAR